MSFSGNKITKKTIDNLTVGSICQEKLFDLQSIENKRIEFSFTASDISSDGGLLLVKNIESQTGIINVLVNCIGNTGLRPFTKKGTVGEAGWNSITKTTKPTCNQVV